MINISICLSDIPESARKKSDKNGKIYASFNINERQTPDQYGNTHSVSISQSKEERQSNTPKVYVGSGKEYIFQSNTPQNNSGGDVGSGEVEPDPLPF